MTGQLCLYVHFKFSDEGIFGNADMELYFLWHLHAICHAARDDGDGIATAHGGVDVVAVNVPVILKIGGMLENKKMVAWLTPRWAKIRWWWAASQGCHWCKCRYTPFCFFPSFFATNHMITKRLHNLVYRSWPINLIISSISGLRSSKHIKKGKNWRLILASCECILNECSDKTPHIYDR